MWPSKEELVSVSPARGLPLRMYLPILAAIAAIFISVMLYLLRIGFGVTGTALGPSVQALHPAGASIQAPQNVGVGGGPPAPVRAELEELRARIAQNPGDDVALVQLADLYLAANKFHDAIPLYKRALRANPKNAAAQAGLQEAQTGLQQRSTP